MKSCLFICLALCVFSSALAMAARYSEDKYSIEPNQDRLGSGRDLGSWLLELAQHAERLHKRNSEIINSLLGLPKVLNDAGR